MAWAGGACGTARARGGRMPPGRLLGPGVDAAEITSWKIPLLEMTGEGQRPRRRQRLEAPRARGMGQSGHCQRLGGQPHGDPARRAPRHLSSGTGPGSLPEPLEPKPERADRCQEGAPAGRGAVGAGRPVAVTRPGSERPRSGPRPAPPRHAGRPCGQ